MTDHDREPNIKATRAMGGESKLGQLQGNTLLSTARSLCLFFLVAAAVAAVAAVATALWALSSFAAMLFCVLPYCCCYCSKRAIQSIDFDLQNLYVEIRIDHNTNVLKIMFLMSRPTIGDRLESCFCVRVISRGSMVSFRVKLDPS